MALNKPDQHIYRKLHEAVNADFSAALFLVVKYATLVADAHALGRDGKLILTQELDNLVEAVRELGTSQP